MPSAWRKAPEWLIEIFERAFPLDPLAERRSMFGYPSGFANGNMFTGLFQESLFVRLDGAGRAELLSIEGASLFEPMAGRPMREYVVLPAELLEDADTVRSWMGRALAFVASLPPKAKGKGKPKAAAKAKAEKKVVANAKPAAPRGRKTVVGSSARKPR